MIKSKFGNIPLEELAGLPTFMAATLSHDRSKIAFYWDKTGQLELYVMEVKSNKEPQQVSKGDLPKSPRSAPVWSRDDVTIFFPKDNDGDEQNNIWCLNLETGEAQQLTDNPEAQEYPLAVSPDNKSLLVASNLNGQLNLYTLDLATNEYTQLTDYSYPASDAKYSPDGSQIVFRTNETDDTQNYDIYLMNADGSEQGLILNVKSGSQDGVSDWSSDGRYLSVTSDAFGANRIGIYDIETAKVRWITPEDKTYYDGTFSPDGQRLLAMLNEDSMANIQVWDVASGDEVETELPSGMSFGSDWLDDGNFFVNIVTDVTRPELRTYQISDGASDVMLPAEYGSIDPYLPH